MSARATRGGRRARSPSRAPWGLPSRGSIGYEIFDEPDALGQTQFQQNINRLRALEGELARTIGKLYGQFKRQADELRRMLTLEADRMDEEQRLKQLIARRRAAEESRRRAQAAGEATRAQQQPDEAAAAALVDPIEPANDAPVDEIPPGFTPDQWADLPAHIKDIVRRRRTTT